MGLENRNLYLENRKLYLEIKELEYRNTWFNRLIGTFITTVLTAFITLALGYFSLRLQHINQENQTFISLIEQATTADTDDGRIAGIWMLNPYWRKKNVDTKNHLANTLTGILMSHEDSDVLLAAAEVIGNAYNQEDWKENKYLRTNVFGHDKRKTELESLRTILYGNGATRENGSLTWANQRLSQECKKSKAKKEACQKKLDATKEAIRKNWENLENTNLRLTDLSKAQLYEAHLKNAYFIKANLTEANFREADLTGANLTGANLTGANLTGAKLLKSYPKNKPPMEANLTEANLSGANLSGANLSGANLSGANLSGANLSGAKNLTNKQIKLACNWEKAIFASKGWDDKKQKWIIDKEK